MNRKLNVLMDLSLSAVGMSGIPLETKWLYKNFINSKIITISGLIYDTYSKQNIVNFVYDMINPMLSQSLYFAELLDSKEDIEKNKLTRLIKRYKNAFINIYKKDVFLEKITESSLKDTIYRCFFEKGLSGKDYETIINSDYYISNLTNSLMSTRLKYNMNIEQPYMNTKDFDIILHEDSRTVKVHPKTQKIIRYHDFIPILSPDVVGNSSSYGYNHYYSIKKCIEQKSIYVCSSKPTQEVLLQTFPLLENKSTVIPISISDELKHVEDYEYLLYILKIRYSSSINSLTDEVLKVLYKAKNKSLEYIFTVSTIEPRKNYLNLIRAFNIVKTKLKRDIKLILVGRLGWKYENILKIMMPFIKKGDIIPLENVSQIEMNYLYSHASVFVYPTFSEGFGLPPIEAMKCATPVVSSNIKVHKWVQEDASLFVNPYDEQDIADKIYQLIVDNNIRNTMISKGIIQASKYNSKYIIEKWNDFFLDFQNCKFK